MYPVCVNCSVIYIAIGVGGFSWWKKLVIKEKMNVSDNVSEVDKKLCG